MSCSLSVCLSLSPSLGLFLSALTAWLYNSVFFLWYPGALAVSWQHPNVCLVNTPPSVFFLSNFFYFFPFSTSSSPFLLPSSQRLRIDSLLRPSASSSIGWAPYPRASFHILAPEAREEAGRYALPAMAHGSCKPVKNELCRGNKLHPI